MLFVYDPGSIFRQFQRALFTQTMFDYVNAAHFYENHF